MAANENVTWYADNPVRLEDQSGFSSIVLYKDVDENEENNWKAHFCDQEAGNSDVLNIAIGRTEIEVLDDKKNITFIISPFKVKYEKEIYKPGKVEILMHVTEGDHARFASQLRQMFLKREVKVSLVTWQNDEPKKYISIAKGFIIQSLNMTQQAGNDTVATLTCYSPDYRMTMDKYCETYTCQRLGTDIIKNEIQKFNGVGDIDVDMNNLMFTAYDKNTFSVSARPDNGNDKDTDGRDELLQPFLIQYNESFYDFICRNANRCGEFLYYEDGKLHLGLPEATRGALVENPVGLPLLTPFSVTYPDIPSDITSGIKTDNFFYDPAGKNKEENTDGAPYSIVGNAKPDIAEYKDFSYPKVDIFKDGLFVVGLMSTFCKSVSLGETIGNVLSDAAVKMLRYQTDWYPFGARKRQEKEYDKLKKNVKDHPIPGTPLVQASNDISSMFYAQVRDCENKAEAQKISMYFDNAMPDARLAAAFTLNDDIAKAYVVTKMSGEMTLDTQFHTAEALPRLENPAEHLNRDTNAVKALIVPPSLPAQNGGASAPLKAVVKDAKDPYRLGRVRVVFSWQEKDAANKDKWSNWIPVITPFSGKKDNEGGHGGFFMMPEVGSQVIVDFVDHNIDDPFVIGSFYAKGIQEAPGYGFEYDSTLSFATAGDPSVHVQTIRSSNGHGITLFDSPDIHFLQDNIIPPLGQALNVISKKTGKKIGLDIDTCKGGGMVLSDSAGFYNITMNADKRSINIDSPLGTINLNAFTGITIKAPNGDINITGKNVKISAGNNLTLESGTNVKTKENNIFGVMGESFLTKAGSAILDDFNKSGGSGSGFNFTKATDITFLRNAWEVLMRPVEGTLSISTPRNITMKAGKGKPIIPVSLLSSAERLALKGGKPSIIGKDVQPIAKSDNLVIVRILQMMTLVKNDAEEFYKKYESKIKSVLETVTQLSTTDVKILELLKTLKENNIGTAQTLYKILCTPEGQSLTPWQIYSAIDANKDKLTPIKEGDIAKYYIQGSQELTDAQANLEKLNQIIKKVNLYSTIIKKELEKVSSYDKATEALCKQLDNIVRLGNFYWTKNIHISASDLGNTKVKIIDYGNDFKNGKVLFADEGAAKNIEEIKGNLEDVLKHIYAHLIYELKYYFKDEKSKDEQKNISKWEDSSDFTTWVNSLKLCNGEELKKRDGVKSKFEGLVGALDKLTKGLTHSDQFLKLVNWNGCAGPRAMSDVTTTSGSILMSNDAGVTYMMKESGDSFEKKQNPDINQLKELLIDHVSAPVVAAPIVAQNAISFAVAGNDNAKELKKEVKNEIAAMEIK